MQEESFESDAGGSAGAASNNSVGGGETLGAARSVSSSTPTTKFTLTQNESRLVLELFAWLVEPCLAFIRREVTEMVSDVIDFAERRGLQACPLAANPSL